MKLRIIINVSDAGMAANVGGPVSTERKTFDVPATPELEAFLTKRTGTYEQRFIEGVEILIEASHA